MSYVMVEDVPASWERYELIARSLADRPRGLVLHAAGPTDEGFRIVEVWETEADWREFEEAMGVALRAADQEALPRPVVRTFSSAHVVLGLGATDGAATPHHQQDRDSAPGGRG